MSEQWKPIPGYKDYEASSQGRIRSLDRISRRGQHIKGKVLHVYEDRDGYESLTLYTEKGRRTQDVHRLVALAFHGRPPSRDYTVNHKNGRRSDNRPENLEWSTHSENITHAYRVLGRTRNSYPGEQNGRAIMTEAQVREARGRYTGKRGEVSGLAQALAVPYKALWMALKGRSWRHL